MPFRSVVSPTALRFQRSFHLSAIRSADIKNHYETLQIPQTASPSDIKKSFYNLSKTHHPDHNPNDPSASTRFVKISEAYAVLGQPEKRQRYDRDVMESSHGSSHSNATPRGSYHSSGPAGGRPASGLSRRRTHVRGPPPSFYRSGGWGNQSAKRQAAQEEGSSSKHKGAEGNQGATTGGGMGPRQQPLGCDDDVPHFDREGHLRTQSNHERRRQNRMSTGFVPTSSGNSTLADFFFVGSIISLGILIPSYIFERASRQSRSEK